MTPSNTNLQLILKIQFPLIPGFVMVVNIPQGLKCYVGIFFTRTTQLLLMVTSKFQ